MLDICKDTIKKEMKESDFLAVISDDTTDVSNHSQNVVAFRYIKDKTVVERFWSFRTLSQGDASTIALIKLRLPLCICLLCIKYLRISLKISIPSSSNTEEKSINKCKFFLLLKLNFLIYGIVFTFCDFCNQ